MVLSVDDHGTELNMSIDYWDAKVSSTVANQIATSVKVTLTQVLEDSSQQVSRVQKVSKEQSDNTKTRPGFSSNRNCLV